MRVAFIALHFAEYSAHLAAALAERNDVLLILYGDNARNELGDRLHREFNHPHLSVVVLERPKGVRDVLRNARTLIAEVRGFSPEVVHLQEDLRDELVLSLFVFRRYPRLLTIHDPVNHSGLDAQRVRFSRYRIYRALVRAHVDGVFTHGAALVEAVAAQQPRLRGRIFSVPHGPLGSSAALEHPSPAHKTSFLFFGRIHEYKGLKYFVQAIQRLHQEGMSVCGVIAGRGSDLAPNRELIAQTPEAFQVIERYISEEEVQRLFTETTAAVLPYVDGTQSGVAAMALGYGKPVIATRVGAIPELVRDGVNGVLVAPRDVDALANAMKLMIQDPHFWQTLAEGSAQLRDGELSWRQIAVATEVAYRAVLGA